MLEQADNDRTILDYLNEDCWRAVLEYVPVRNLICTERTSRKWQRMILVYLSSVRIRIGINMWLLDKNVDSNIDHNYVAIRTDTVFSSFELWCQKLGHSVVSFGKGFPDFRNSSMEKVMVLNNNCPNLEVLELLRVSLLQTQMSPTRSEELFPRLKRLHVESCDGDTDDCLSSLITSSNLEELKILSTNLTGVCLNNIKSGKLKSLVIRKWEDLTLEPLFSIADRLGGLTKFVLTSSGSCTLDRIHLLLTLIPKLEYLTIRIDYAEEVDSDVFYTASSSLVHLKHLNSNIAAENQHLEQVTRCCKQLDYLKLYCRGVTGRGVDAVCSNVGERLQCLDLLHSDLTDDDVGSCVYRCPKLTYLRVSGDLLRFPIRHAATARRAMGFTEGVQDLELICEDSPGVETDYAIDDFENVIDFAWIGGGIDSDEVGEVS